MATRLDSDKCLQTHSWLQTKFPTKQHSSNPHQSLGSSYSPNYQDSDQSDSIASPSPVQPMKKKRRRAAAAAAHSPHKLRRRDQINKKIRALRNLIPNCTKMDKESILDEAIYYLKSLQLQLQIMPTFGGLCVPMPMPLTPTPTPTPSSLQLFGLLLAGYGTKLQMPINAQPPQPP